VISREIRLGAADEGGGVADAVEVLRGGGLLVHPTGTVYGIGGAATEEVERKIAELKGRPPKRPCIRLAGSVDRLRRLLPQVPWSERTALLARTFWPGPLTLVVDDGTEEGIAVRVDGHPGMRRILERWGGLFLSTSLNRSGGRPTGAEVRARAVAEALPDVSLPIAFLAAGDLPGPPSSTILSLRPEGSRARVLRAGAVPVERIEACLGAGFAR